MSDKYEIVNFMDRCRWSQSVKNNYGLINYCRNDLSNDSKLLTHWVSYITDRQTSYEKIWDVGGFVFSDMIYNYKNTYGLKVLNPNFSKAFFRKKEDGGFTFISNKIVSDSPYEDGIKLLEKYGFGDNNQVTFTSRFYPADYVSMFYTLHTLNEFDRDFIKYIENILTLVNDNTAENLVKSLAYGLYILTYDNINQPTKEDLIYEELLEKAKLRTKNIVKLLNDRSFFEQSAKQFYSKKKQFEIKRIWCCIRDYIKSNEFGTDCLKVELINRKVDSRIIRNLFSRKAFATIELPGDLWNNNEKFGNCLFGKDTIKNNKHFNRFLRSNYEMDHSNIWYPEQFDFSFDFVRNMCQKDNCDICPFKLYNNLSRIKKICSCDKHKYCTIALATCGYKCMCKLDECPINRSMS